MKYLVIVESPTKARTISRFLGDDYKITSSMGHVMDLPKSKLSVDVQHDFAPQYEVMSEKKQLIAELKKYAKDAQIVYLATDPDREGEAISANIQELISDKKAVPAYKFKRIVFHEITETAIKHALEEPRNVDVHLVDAQTARRVLDRLVGYELSPLLWKKVRRGLSAGRVQSVALRLLVEREREIQKFAKEPYFTIEADLLPENAKVKKDTIIFALIEINGEKLEKSKTYSLYDGEYTSTKTTIDTKEKADAIVEDLKKKAFIVSDVAQKQSKRSPLPPFTTSTLQQDASRRFGYPGKRTMSLAQKLYEEGFITYHRTDSVILATTAVTAMRGYIEKSFGEKYLPTSPRFYATKQKAAQEAHEAIRPTKFQAVEVGKEAVTKALGADYAKLYELIWKRAVASQMSDALLESTTITVSASGVTKDTYTFRASGSVLLFDGFLRLTPQALQDNRLPMVTKDEKMELIHAKDEAHETTPPPRYNDASLIGALEEKGIGRPSTYASIISTIVDRGYVERVEKRFQPTSVGMAVNDFLVTNFSSIDDIPFTAAMEDKLDQIASADLGWVKMMKEFYTPFAKQLKEVEGATRVKIEVEQVGEDCPLCGSPLVIRYGKFGKFISCSTFPECKFTKPLVKEIDLPCPKCGNKIVQRKTRKGRIFYGCSNYPNCDFAAWKIEDIKHPNLEKKEVTDSTGEKTKIIKSAKKRNMVSKVVSKKRS
jgi:DNA topoisomerase-1